MMLKLKKATFAIVAVFTMGGGLLSLPPKEVSARTTYVWIAPNHGKRYHYSKGCRGLNNAGQSITVINCVAGNISQALLKKQRLID